MIRRIMLWLRPNKKCSGLCLFCKYYEECSMDFGKGNMTDELSSSFWNKRYGSEIISSCSGWNSMADAGSNARGKLVILMKIMWRFALEK